VLDQPSIAFGPIRCYSASANNKGILSRGTSCQCPEQRAWVH
jgi:hypothetical protein